MKRRAGFATSFPPFRYRLDVASHDFAGGNTFTPLAIMDYWNGVNRDALHEGIQRSVGILQTAATVEVQAGRSGDSVLALVRVTNLTGHKLPTGTPESRQLWVSVIGRDGAGRTLFQSGTYDASRKQFLRDPQAKVYECISGITSGQAATYGKTSGPSFFRSLNDTVLFDNRIPPRGFSYSSFRERRCAPVGYNYSEGQYWDVASYSMGGDVESVSVSLWYQVASKEFIEFLRDENVGNPYDWNDWGKKIYEAWHSYGAPVRVAQQAVVVQNSAPQLPSVVDVELPQEIRIAQNYPNPFNARSTIEFWIGQSAHVSLVLYNIAGREVEQLIDGELKAGLHLAYVDGSNLSTGVYFYHLRVQHQSATRKLILIR